MDMGLIVFCLIVGIVLAFVPVDGTVRNIIVCVLVIAVVLSLLHGFGVTSGTRHWNF